MVWRKPPFTDNEQRNWDLLGETVEGGGGGGGLPEYTIDDLKAVLQIAFDTSAATTFINETVTIESETADLTVSNFPYDGDIISFFDLYDSETAVKIVLNGKSMVGTISASQSDELFDINCSWINEEVYYGALIEMLGTVNEETGEMTITGGILSIYNESASEYVTGTFAIEVGLATTVVPAWVKTE